MTSLRATHNPPAAERTLKQWLLDALDLLADFDGLVARSSDQARGPEHVPCAAVAHALDRLADFSAQAFAFPSEHDALFELTYCRPEADHAFLMGEVEHQLRLGTFGWALNKNHAVLIPAQSDGRTLVLHSIAAGDELIGMFVGVLNGHEAVFPDACRKLLTVLLSQCAWQTRNARLQQRLREANEGLERRVQMRTLELTRSEARAKAANEAKSRFLAMMSHEIRTPLNAVCGLVELLDDSEDPQEQAEYRRTIHASGQHLLGVVNDVLDFAKIEDGKLQLEPARFRLQQTIEDVVNLFRPQAESKGLTLSLECSPDVNATVIADEVRIRQVLANLLSNAVKFTSTGGVSVTCQARTQQQACHLSVAVADTGIGFAMTDAARLFEPFQQKDASTTRRFGGTGLGLTICRRILEAMHGTLEAEGVEGQGATFRLQASLELAARGESELPAPAHSQQPLAGLRVLAAEDNGVNALIVARLLGRCGASAAIAKDGVEALAMLEDDHYDVILMDCEMPRMDGFEATRRIRRRGDEKAAVPIIALTANAIQGDRERCLDAGMDRYLTKPIRRQVLVETIVELAQPAQEAS